MLGNIGKHYLHLYFYLMCWRSDEHIKLLQITWCWVHGILIGFVSFETNWMDETEWNIRLLIYASIVLSGSEPTTVICYYCTCGAVLHVSLFVCARAFLPALKRCCQWALPFPLYTCTTCNRRDNTTILSSIVSHAHFVRFLCVKYFYNNYYLASTLLVFVVHLYYLLHKKYSGEFFHSVRTHSNEYFRFKRISMFCCVGRGVMHHMVWIW